MHFLCVCVPVRLCVSVSVFMFVFCLCVRVTGCVCLFACTFRASRFHTSICLSVLTSVCLQIRVSSAGLDVRARSYSRYMEDKQGGRTQSECS